MSVGGGGGVGSVRGIDDERAVGLLGEGADF